MPSLARSLSGGGGGGDVASVFGRTGVVVAEAGDYEIADITGLSAALAAKAASADLASHTGDTSNPHGVTAAQAGAVPTARTITAGNGLTGGGDLSANRSLAANYGSPVAVGAANGDGAANTLARSDHVHKKYVMSVRAQTGTSDTLVLADQDNIVTHTNVAVITETVPPNSSVAMDIGSSVMLIVLSGSAQLTVVEGAGVTVQPPVGFTRKSRTGGTGDAVMTLIKIGTDRWSLCGDCAPV